MAVSRTARLALISQKIAPMWTTTLVKGGNQHDKLLISIIHVANSHLLTAYKLPENSTYMLTLGNLWMGVQMFEVR